jgi:pyruvate carboxylase
LIGPTPQPKKIIERAPAPYLMEQQKTDLCEATLQLARKAGYQNAGVAKFLMDIKGEAALTEHPGSISSGCRS